MENLEHKFDVAVVGGGNAGLSAALEAASHGASVVLIERTGKDSRGGNSRFTAGAVRFAFDDSSDLRRFIPDVSESELAAIDFGSYPADRFFDDIARVTKYRADPDLADLLVRNSNDAVEFWTSNGVRFTPAFHRQAFKRDGKFTFWGGIVIEAVGGGPGMVEALYESFERQGGEVFYGTRGVELIHDNGVVGGVRAIRDGSTIEFRCPSVILTAGGFQANAEWRTRYMGPGWDLARVRGTWANTGDGIKMALEVGAAPAGHWSGAHAVPWDLNAPEYGDLRIGDQFSKLSYPFGIMVNAEGERFLDEGADFRNFTYAKYGHAIIRQPDHMAWQIFDAKVEELLRDEYRIQEASRVRSDTIEGLVSRMDGVDSAAALATIAKFNDSIPDEQEFNPNVKDGRATVGLQVPKSNWATRIDTPPFLAFAVTCGITFTFGGLRIDPNARVLGYDGAPIAGLYAAGEMIGGLFYHNYPGGSGLTAGTVFGRIAGQSAAQT